MSATPHPEPAAGDAADPTAGSRRWRSVLLVAVACLLVAGGWVLPLWQATLHAPQYPGGLSMSAYGHQVTGDVDEIGALNHYVGMRAFDPETVPEMQLWPIALAVAAIAVVLAALTGRRLVRRLATAYLWCLPLGVLAMIQLRLHQYGTDLDPTAALRLDPFTPWVVGPTKVWNFTTWSRPGLGLVCLVAAAAVVTFGPRLLARGVPRRIPAVAVAVMALAVGVASPAGVAVAADGHDHGAPGHGDGGPDHGSHKLGPEQPADTRSPRIGPAGAPHAMPDVPHHHHTGDLDAILARQDEGTRLVLPGARYSGQFVIDRPVTIEGRGMPVLDGGGMGTVLTIRAPGTVIRDVVVRGSGVGPTGDPAAIRIEADDVTIERVTVLDSYVGIAVDGATDVRLVDNHVHGRAHAGVADDGHAVGDDSAHGAPHGAATPGRGDGIWLHDARNVLIRGNHIEGTRDGVYVSFGSDTLLDGNHVHDTRYAVHSMFADHLTMVENHVSGNLSGAVLMYGGEVLLLRNHVERSTSTSTGFGVLLKDVVNAQVVENLLVDNRIGIHLDGPAGATTDTRFTANTVARNTIGVQAYSSAAAEFRANSFVDNRVQVASQGGPLHGIAWAAEGWGNYWSSYRGFDAHGQGRGAVRHTEGGTVDRLLLRHPELIALADTPALRLLRSVEERWGNQRPVAVDELPLTRPASPPLPAASAPDGRLAGTVIGVLLLLPAASLFVPRPRRRPVATRRSSRVVHT